MKEVWISFTLDMSSGKSCPPYDPRPKLAQASFDRYQDSSQ
jgi:hypothetical protein